MDDFRRLILELSKDSPDLQKAIIDSMKDGRGYSIPTGNILESVFTIEDKAQQDKAVQAVKTAMELKVKDLAHIFGLVRAGLAVKEVTEGELLPHEQTLKDIDIVALATFAMVKYIAFRKEEER